MANNLLLDRRAKLGKPAKMGMSADDISTALQAALAAKYPGMSFGFNPSDIWVRTFYPDDSKVIFTMGGKTYQQSYDMDDSGSVTLTDMPEEVLHSDDYKPVADAAFSTWIDEERSIEIDATATFAGSAYVPWSGPIFESGLYPKQVVDARSPGYIDGMIAKFRGASKFKNGHNPDPESALTGLDLGGCTQVWRVDEKDKAGNTIHVMHGKGFIHRALVALLGKPKVSIEIHDKDVDPSLGNIAIVKIPQVTRAEIVAQFSAFPGYAEMAGARHTKSQMEKIQGIHDAVAEIHPPVCDPAMMSGSPHSKGDKLDFHNLHDLAVKQGATCPGCQKPDAGMSGGDPKKMNPWQHLYEACRGFLKGKPEQAAEVAKQAGLDEAGVAAFSAAIAADVSPAPVTTPAPAAPVVAELSPELQARFSAMEKQLSEANERATIANENALKTASANFAADLKKAKKIVPAMEEEVALNFMEAAKADGAGVAKFSLGGDLQEGPAVKALRAMFAKMPELPFFSTDIGDRMDSPADDLSGAEGAENTDRLLSMSPLGRSGLHLQKQRSAAFSNTGDKLKEVIREILVESGGRN